MNVSHRGPNLERLSPWTNSPPRPRPLLERAHRGSSLLKKRHPIGPYVRPIYSPMMLQGPPMQTTVSKMTRTINMMVSMQNTQKEGGSSMPDRSCIFKTHRKVGASTHRSTHESRPSLVRTRWVDPVGWDRRWVGPRFNLGPTLEVIQWACPRPRLGHQWVGVTPNLTSLGSTL